MSPVAARPSRYSQCGRILRVLEEAYDDPHRGWMAPSGAGDGWVSASYIFWNLPAGATIHSRISELRKTWGYEIEHETRGPGAAGSFYRLALPEKAQPPVYLEDFAPGEILNGDFPMTLQEEP